MNLSEKYAYKVYEKRSFSLAASQLFVSQPALSSTIARLEASLGFKIFDRSTSPLTLTAKGRIYIDYLEESIQNENNLQLRISRVSGISGGTLSIGALCHSSYIILPSVCAEFMKLYPNADIDINTGNARNFGSLTEAMKRNKLDLILTYRYEDKEFTAETLLDERLLIAINKNSPNAKDFLHLSISAQDVISNHYPKEKTLTDLSALASLSLFSFTNVGNSFNRLIDRFDNGYIPSRCTIKNAEHLTMHYEMLKHGVAAVITSDVHILYGLSDCEDIVYLVPECPEAYRTLNLIKPKNSADNPLIEPFVSLIKKTCTQLAQKEVCPSQII